MKRLKKTNKRSNRRAAETPLDCDLNASSSIALDLESELSSLLAKNKLLPSDDTSQLILANSKITPYTAAKHEVLNDFLTCLSLAPKEKWNKLLQTTTVLLPNGEAAAVPYIITNCSGFKTAAKLAIVNQALIDWNKLTKKKRVQGPNSKFPWYQPVTQNQRIRAFFGHVNKKYLWQMTTDDFEGERMLGTFFHYFSFIIK